MDLVQGSIVESVDRAFLFIVGVSAVFLLGITAVMIFFVVRYSRRRNPEPTQIEGSIPLEVLWTAVPTVLVLLMFYYGYQGFALMRSMPEDAMEVRVVGRMWDWSFQYENGRETDRLYVPVDQPIKLLLTSVDVIHSFYMPAFRVKEDAVPNKTSYLWFKPQTTGPADIFCAEYCGQRHAYMLSQVVVMEQEEFESWYAGTEAREEASADAEALDLFGRHGCMACHGFDRTGARGVVTLRGILGRETTVLRGQERFRITADEAYIRRAILDPDAEILEGHEAIMPVPEDLEPDDLDRMVKYLKELR